MMDDGDEAVCVVVNRMPDRPASECWTSSSPRPSRTTRSRNATRPGQRTRTGTAPNAIGQTRYGRPDSRVDSGHAGHGGGLEMWGVEGPEDGSAGDRIVGRTRGGYEGVFDGSEPLHGVKSDCRCEASDCLVVGGIGCEPSLPRSRGSHASIRVLGILSTIRFAKSSVEDPSFPRSAGRRAGKRPAAADSRRIRGRMGCSRESRVRRRTRARPSTGR